MSPEKNYDAIAKKMITTPAQMESKWRLLVYARNKKGKTKFCLSAPNVLVIDPEKGAEKFKTSQASVWPVTKWEDLDDVLGFLSRGHHDFEWVAADGLTRFNNMALRFVMKIREDRNLDQQPGMVDRRDYNKSGELMKELILRFDALKCGVIYTAQERAVGGDSDDETQEATTMYVPDLPQGARGVVNGNVDVIGRLYVTKAQFKNPKDPEGPAIEKNQRRLWIGTHPQYDTGYRSDHELPDFIRNPTVKKVTDLMLSGAS